MEMANVAHTTKHTRIAAESAVEPRPHHASIARTVVGNAVENEMKFESAAATAVESVIANAKTDLIAAVTMTIIDIPDIVVRRGAVAIEVGAAAEVGAGAHNATDITVAV